MFRVQPPTFKSVLDQIQLLQDAWILTSDWIKLRGSHAIHKSVTCCKTSLSRVSETCTDFVARVQRTTFYFLQQLFATCNNLIYGGNRTNAVQRRHRCSLHFTCPHHHEGMKKERNKQQPRTLLRLPRRRGPLFLRGHPSIERRSNRVHYKGSTFFHSISLTRGFNPWPLALTSSPLSTKLTLLLLKGLCHRCLLYFAINIANYVSYGAMEINASKGITCKWQNYCFLSANMLCFLSLIANVTKNENEFWETVKDDKNGLRWCC